MSVAPRWGYPRRQRFEFQTGTVLVYSDAHYWPGEAESAAFRALLTLADALRPVAIIANGDLIDGARISRHGRIGWARLPDVRDEIDVLQERQARIRDAAPRAKRFRTVGNHDIRYDNWLSANAGDYEGINGFRLADFLPAWPESWSVQINDCIIKHRFKGGIHAAWNNVRDAGCHILTGHLHRLEARSWRGYGPRLWGIESGTLANLPQDLPDEGAGPFEYLEDAPTCWAAGFPVLTWHKGALLRPEFCEVVDGTPYFRGRRVSCGATHKGDTR